MRSDNRVNADGNKAVERVIDGVKTGGRIVGTFSLTCLLVCKWISSGKTYSVIAGWHKGSLEIILCFFSTHFQLYVCR